MRPANCSRIRLDYGEKGKALGDRWRGCGAVRLPDRFTRDARRVASLCKSPSAEVVNCVAAHIDERSAATRGTSRVRQVPHHVHTGRVSIAHSSEQDSPTFPTQHPKNCVRDETHNASSAKGKCETPLYHQYEKSGMPWQPGFL